MSDRIVATEEVRDSLALQDIERPDEVAEHGSSGRYGATGYTLTERGRRAFEENEGF